MADIFVSYTSSDREWAFWIAKQLETLGHLPHVHDWEIKGSDDIYAWMEQHLDAADHVLCIISDNYLKAPYSTLERHAALWRAAKGDGDEPQRPRRPASGPGRPGGSSGLAPRLQNWMATTAPQATGRISDAAARSRLPSETQHPSYQS